MPLLGSRGAASSRGFGSLANLGYFLRNSLRFRGSNNAYLSRTPASAGTGTGKTWTWSGWVKRGTIGSSDLISLMYGATSGGASDRGGFGFYTFSGGGTGSDSLTLYYNANFANNLTTTQVFRDPSAWYHIIYAVDTTQATASNRVKLYVNGVQVTDFSASNYPTQNYQFAIGNNVAQWISSEAGTQRYFDGYLAELNFIDGQALTPSSFGKTDAATGQWIPKQYSGTYGTNGFYLPFTNTTSTSTLVADSSGNGNNWTPNNISLTAGVTYDSMTDVSTLGPTASNYAVLNPLANGGGTLSGGNLNMLGASSAWGTRLSTIAVSSDKWYCEITPTSGSSTQGIMFGISNFITPPSGHLGAGSTSYGYYGADGALNFNGSSTPAFGATVADNDVVGIALDLTAGTLEYYKNNVKQGTTITGISGQFYFGVSCYGTATASINFGQRPFAYTPPSGFKSLNAFNLP